MSTPARRPGLMSLFSLSFDHYLTGSIVKVIYVCLLALTLLNAALTLCLFGLSGVGLMTAAATSESMGGAMVALGIVFIVLGVLFGAVIFVLGVLGSRVACESAIVAFRIADHVRDMAEALKATPRLSDGGA